MTKRMARYRADNLAELQKAILDAFAGIANKWRPKEVRSTFGPLALDLIEERDRVHFQIVAVTAEELRQERQ